MSDTIGTKFYTTEGKCCQENTYQFPVKYHVEVLHKLFNVNNVRIFNYSPTVRAPFIFRLPFSGNEGPVPVFIRMRSNRQLRTSEAILNLNQKRRISHAKSKLNLTLIFD